MGWQARSRGTYEERKAAAIKRDIDLAQKRRIKRLESERNLTPQQKSAINTQRIIYAQMAALAAIPRVQLVKKEA